MRFKGTRTTGKFNRTPTDGDARLIADHSTLPLRAWRAFRDRGPRYAWHKTLRRALSPWPALKRRFVYADPREYWTLRGGLDYFREQEGQAARSERAQIVAEKIARYRPLSILEVGCGYGKQLRALRKHLPRTVPLSGVDFSPTQLEFAREYLKNDGPIPLFLAEGERLPFADQSFDLVFTSAVVLHHPAEVADRIRLELLRVARRFVAHNEDTDVSYNRYGHDTAGWYRARGIPLAESGPLPILGDPLAPSSQFCVAIPCRS